MEEQFRMSKGMQYKIGIVYLFLFLIFSAVSIKPIAQPVGDGAAYYKIAGDYRSFLRGKMDGLRSYLYRDRMLPATTAGVVADLLKIPVSEAFHIIALLAITLFYFFSWRLLAEKVTNIVAMTGLWIAYTLNSYPITWNLFNVYQLTDSMAYLWIALIAISFVDKKLFLFIPISFLAIITKQNLWCLVLPGYLFFLSHYLKTKENKKIFSTVFFGSIVLSAVLYMFFTEAGHIQNYVSNGFGKIFESNTYKGRELGVLKAFFWIYLPVLPVIFIKYKEVCKKAWEYFPLAPLVIVSFFIVWPICLAEPSMDAYPRIMQPVIWPLCAYVVMFIVNDFDKLKNRSLLWVLYLAPVFFGVKHLAFYTISFKPLFIFPAIFRHLLVLFLAGVYFFIWRQRKARKIKA